jgi:AcrR family transcriptional regulator
MSKAKKRFEEMRTRSEEKILTAALELFATNGYKNTSISGIAKKAGISKGLMYNYFESKNALLRAIVQKAIAEGTDIVNHAIEDYDTPIEELKHFIIFTIEHVKTNFQFWKLLSSLAHQQNIMESIGDLLEEQKKWGTEIGIKLFTELKSPHPLLSAMLFGAALDGVILGYLFMKDDYPIDAMSEILTKTFTDPNSIHINI